MGRKKKSAEESAQLTPFELELMTVLWKRGEASVHQVLEALPPDKEYAYNTISTVLRLLVAKGVAAAVKEGRQHAYVPLLSKSDYESRAVSQIVESVFDGEPTSLVKRLLGETQFTAQELEEIRSMLEAKERS